VWSTELAREWLDPAMPKEQAEQMALNLGDQPHAFEWFPVNIGAGNMRNQGPEMISPV
jgi:putative SOS response-associated peptidase YedK